MYGYLKFMGGFCFVNDENFYYLFVILLCFVSLFCCNRYNLFGVIWYVGLNKLLRFFVGFLLREIN